MNHPNYTVERWTICFAFIAIILLGAYIFYDELTTLAKAQSGELQLMCNDTIISPELIMDFDSGTHTWIFTNGYATNCELLTPKDY